MSKNIEAKYRLLISRIFLIIVVFLLLLSDNKVNNWSPAYTWLEFFGYSLGLVGIIGRIWSSLFIEGFKTKTLITKGPYSLMRNPLYFFSFILLLGFCLFIKSMIIFIVFLIIWILIYRKTMNNEESNLISNHDKDYMIYFNKTPKILPNFNLYRPLNKNEKMNIHIFKVERVLKESFGFLFLFGLIKLIEFLQLNGILPVYFHLI